MYAWPIEGCEGKALYFTWVFRQDVDIADVRLQNGETADARWVTAQQLREMVAEGTFIPYDYLEELFALQ